MKKYFYSNEEGKNGPVTLEELKQNDIKPKTLIWHDGLDDWKEAESIDELREIFELSPPPLDNENGTSIDLDVDDLNSINQTTATKTYAGQIQVKSSNPFSFDGRIGRTEFVISFIIVFMVNKYLNTVVASGELPIIGLAYIPTLWFLWAQGAKRCHDVGNNGWWQIIPFYVFWLFFQNGKPGLNEYGKNPKG